MNKTSFSSLLFAHVTPAYYWKQSTELQHDQEEKTIQTER
jgi:hypothetical protein